jgi:hypothetical protein
MTVINKVNDDSESYFRDSGGFVLSFSAVRFFVNSLIFNGVFYF